MKSGIYKLEWNLENKYYLYIGQAINLDRRLRAHINKLKKGTHNNSKIKNIYNKYGEPQFIILEELPLDKDLLCEREQYYIDIHYGKEYCLNLSPTAGTTLGVKYSEESRKKMSEDRTGNKHHFFGGRHKEETKIKIGASQKNKIISEETKAKMSEARIGYVTPEETKNKIRLSLLGNQKSEETKLKMSISRMGSNNPMYGKKMSDETKLKISEARKARNEFKKQMRERNEIQ